MVSTFGLMAGSMKENGKMVVNMEKESTSCWMGHKDQDFGRMERGLELGKRSEHFIIQLIDHNKRLKCPSS